jgi:hypothetical protein
MLSKNKFIFSFSLHEPLIRFSIKGYNGPMGTEMKLSRAVIPADVIKIKERVKVITNFSYRNRHGR